MIQKQMLDTIKPILENNYCPNWKEVSKEIEKIMDDIIENIDDTRR